MSSVRRFRPGVKTVSVLTCALAFALHAAADDGALSIEVASGDIDRPAGAPMRFPIALSPEEANPVTLTAVGDDMPIPVQLAMGVDGKGELSWVLQRPLAAGESRAYRLEFGGAALPGLSVEEDEAALRVVDVDRRPVLVYNRTVTAEAEGFEPVYQRTGYIHPLFSPSGREITGDYPADHPHQHGLFFAWTKSTFDGRALDFWNQRTQTGNVAYRSTSRTTHGPVFAEFETVQRHEDRSAPGGEAAPAPVLDETWTVRVWRGSGDGDSAASVIDIVSTQTCASDLPLTIEKYHYGGMAIRGTAEWFTDDKEAEQPGDFLTSEGLTRVEGNHSRPNWVAMHGRYTDGGHAGVAIFDHPENFRFPQFVRLHPSKPYFVFTPQVEEGFEIKPGEPYVSRFRYVVFDGKPDVDFLEGIWQDYAEPATMTVSSVE